MTETIRNLPDAPGVYQYFDADGRLLYVGKAKSLKKRVRSYFRLTPEAIPAPNLSPRIYRMIAQACRIEYIVTPTENDALLLENSLIKQLKPKYNILLRDDKTYPYLYVDMDQPYPRIEITRKVVKGKNVRYFGPFPSGARALLDSIYELVPLVQKRGCLQGKKACLFFQIGRCMAPCEGKISPAKYRKLIEKALDYVHHTGRLKKALREKMERYAQQLRFEEAATLRDRIEAIDKIETINVADMAKLEDLDLFAVAFDDQGGVVVRLFIREGKVVASSHTWVETTDRVALGEIYRQTILEFYTAQTPFTASAVLTAHDFEDKAKLAELLSRRLGRRVTITAPKRGEKKRLVELALQNAGELLRHKKDRRSDDPMKKIAELLALETVPRRVEIFDNSHLMGYAPVGAMVVFDGGQWDKSAYRHYHLKAKEEYGQMEETLSRRIEAFRKDPPPDLWVLDGGEALRRLAVSLLKQRGIDLPVVAIAKEKIDAKAHRAKGAARDLLYYEGEIMQLLPTDPRLQWFQRLRDEAHRFALAFHKKSRNKEQKQISLLRVKGIGPAKVKKLLDYFGSFEAVKNADIKALEAVLSTTDAANLFYHFHENEKTV